MTKQKFNRHNGNGGGPLPRFTKSALSRRKVLAALAGGVVAASSL